MKLLVVALIASFGLAAHANQHTEASFSRTFPFPLTSYQKVEESMAAAAARTGEDMNKWVEYTIDSNFTLKCAEDSPSDFEGHLYGCVLSTNLDVGGTRVVLQNLMYPQQSSSEISDLLSKTDVNTVDNVQLKSPFDGGHGSSYFCNAEGAAGARAWNCYLYFVD